MKIFLLKNIKNFFIYGGRLGWTNSWLKKLIDNLEDYIIYLIYTKKYKPSFRDIINKKFSKFYLNIEESKMKVSEFIR